MAAEERHEERRQLCVDGGTCGRDSDEAGWDGATFAPRLPVLPSYAPQSGRDSLHLLQRREVGNGEVQFQGLGVFARPRTEREERRGDPYLARHTPIPIQVIRFEGPFQVTRRHHRDATRIRQPRASRDSSREQTIADFKMG